MRGVMAALAAAACAGWLAAAGGSAIDGRRTTMAMGTAGTAGAGEAARPVRVALVTDTHIADGDSEEQSRFRGHLLRVITEVNAAGVDAVLVAGDLTQGGAPAEIARFRRMARGFRAPVIWVAGNHDAGNKRAGDDPGPTAERIAAYEAAAGPSFAARTVRGMRVVAANASLMGSELPREAEQWAFLERELGKRARRPVLLLLHNPPFVKRADEPGDYWNLEPAPRARLLALAHTGGVRAILSGHLHYPVVAEREGVAFITAMPVSFGLPAGKQPEGWMALEVSPDGAVRVEPRLLTGP